MSRRRAWSEAAQAKRTGWQEGMLQDDSRDLSRWLAGKPDAPMHAREAAEAAQADAYLCDYPQCVERGCDLACNAALSPEEQQPYEAEQ